MKAIMIHDFGGPVQMYMKDVPDPSISPYEVLIKVNASALNRADLLQRQGKYPPPLGASDIMGLEVAGEVVEQGSKVSSLVKGDRVCALLSGGGYAEYVAVDHRLAVKIPESMSFEEAAAIPEVFLTAFQALVYLAKIKKREWVLIHAGGSGVGTATIQLARCLGAKQIIVTASAGKHELCKSLGADVAIDYRSEEFEKVVLNRTSGKGVDVIIDFLAASYFHQNINALAPDGRMVMLALMGGAKAESINLAKILVKRLHIMGSTLRARDLDYKIRLTQDFWSFAMPMFNSGELKPVIDRVFDWSDVADAHRYMEANKNKGKIVLNVTG